MASKGREGCGQEGFQVQNITRDQKMEGCINQGDVMAS